MRSNDDKFGAANRCTVNSVVSQKYTPEGVMFQE